MRETRTPEEVAGGYILVDWGDRPRQLPTLKIRAERDWKYELGEILNSHQLTLDVTAIQQGGEAAIEALQPLARLPTELMLDLIVSYDKTGALGGRETLEENCDSAQLYTILRALLRVVFPFSDDLASLIVEARKLMQMVRVESLLQQTLTNGQQPTGELDPIESKKSLTMAS